MDGKTIRNKLVGSDDERAVSPVIGVILMVAITVILAAVIATLVMDFGDSVEQEANAGVVIETTGSDATVTWQTGGNAEWIDLNVDSSTQACADVWQAENPGSGGSGTGELSTVGASETLDESIGGVGGTSNACQDESGTISAIAVTEDGDRTVVQTENFDFN
ncbi:type IV pilin [Halovivax cerinus]|uniref:Type IV pilin n=1 Tax=Halovivax cerinus TaxID=1487865 RepID=A0ABD5NTW3_9EURY|nr:type IV pilin N-terminal domain-containing protein [Halovivax cerinus]